MYVLKKFLILFFFDLFSGRLELQLVVGLRFNHGGMSSFVGWKGPAAASYGVARLANHPPAFREKKMTS